MAKFKKIATVNEIKEGKLIHKELKFYKIALTKFRDTIIAFEDICTHDGGQISKGDFCDGIITCPRHSAKFDVKTGEAICLPATESIPVYTVRIVGDDVEVELED